MMLGWVHVFMILVVHGDVILHDTTECSSKLSRPLRFALIISFLEVSNALLGVTRSQPQQVALFAIIRASIEGIVAPMLVQECPHPSHLITVFCWSCGDSIRFFCFLSDVLFGGIWAKTIRYTVGPILFPVGTLGEMWMVLAAANRQSNDKVRYAMYGAASLWPAGFYPLFKQLLKQRRKFFSQETKKIQ
jgi:hypothetical protein